MAIQNRQKRQSTTPAAGIAKKRRTVLKQCNDIAAVVRSAENFPEKVLKMVSGSVSDCLGAPKEERHAYQEKVIQMVGDVLGSVEAGVQKSIEAAEAKLNSASSEKATRDQAHEATVATVTARAEALEAAKAALAESALATKSAKAAVREAEDAQADGDLELKTASDKKAKFHLALHEKFLPLKAGSAEGVQSNISALCKLGKEFHFDTSMLTSLPAALAKEPSERGTFDAMVWQQLEDELTKRVQDLEDMLASGEPAKAARAATADSARTALESARSHEESCKTSLQQSQTESGEAKLAHKAATKAVSQFGPEMKEVEKDLASAKADLAAFIGGASAAYKELLDYSAIPPPAPPAAEEATEGAPNAAE